MRKLKDIIRENRQKQKMTQRDLANKLNISDKQISKWETGVSYPDTTILNNLADELGISVLELLGSEELKKRELENKIDYNFLTYIKINSLISITLLLVALVFVVIGTIGDFESESLRIVFVFPIGFLLIIASYLIHKVSKIKEENFLKNQVNKTHYTKKIYYKNITYINIYMVLLIIIIILTSINYIKYNIVASDIFHAILDYTVAMMLNYILFFTSTIILLIMTKFTNRSMFIYELKAKYTKTYNYSKIVNYIALALLILVSILIPTLQIPLRSINIVKALFIITLSFDIIATLFNVLISYFVE